MPDHMADLLLSSPGVVESVTHLGPVGVMALHGRLERRTEFIAAAVANRTRSSLYTVTLPSDLWWHVPSHRFGERPSRALRAFLDKVEVVVSIHGHGRPGMEDTVLLGGSNRTLAAEFDRRLAGSGLEVVSDLDRLPAGLRGMSPSNPVNLARRGGVQVEVPAGARTGMGRAALVDGLVAALSTPRA